MALLHPGSGFVIDSMYRTLSYGATSRTSLLLSCKVSRSKLIFKCSYLFGAPFKTHHPYLSSCTTRLLLLHMTNLPGTETPIGRFWTSKTSLVPTCCWNFGSPVPSQMGNLCKQRLTSGSHRGTKEITHNEPTYYLLLRSNANSLQHPFVKECRDR